MSKEEIFTIFSEFVGDLKVQNREMVREIYEANNAELARNYAYTTQAHISRVDATVDNLLSKQNQMQETSVTENSLPGNILK